MTVFLCHPARTKMTWTNFQRYSHSFFTGCI